MEENKIEIKGNFVFINKKLIKPRIIKLNEIGFTYPYKINSLEIAYVDNIITQDEEYIYRIIVIPSKRIGKYYNKFPAHKFEGYSYFQKIKGEGKIQNFYEDNSGRGFYSIEDMKEDITYIIEKDSYVSISNISYERLVIAAKTPKKAVLGRDAFYIGDEIDQNPEFLVFGEKRIKKEEYSLIDEIILRINKS